MDDDFAVEWHWRSAMHLSRRTLIGGTATLVGANAAVLLTEHPSSAVGESVGPADLAGLDPHLLVSITDARTGRCELLVGEHAITFTDRDPVNRIARVSRGAVS